MFRIDRNEYLKFDENRTRKELELRRRELLNDLREFERQRFRLDDLIRNPNTRAQAEEKFYFLETRIQEIQWQLEDDEF